MYIKSAIFVLYKRQNMNTGKRTKKRNNYNEEILTSLAEKYGFSVDYIRKCLRDDRKGVMPDIVKKEYKELESASSKAIQSNIKPTE